MPARSSIPGIKRITRGDRIVWWWVASQLSRFAGDFRPKTVRLWEGADHPAIEDRERIEHQALQLYIQLQEWLYDSKRETPSKRGLVYFVRVGDKVKIGFTRDIDRRLSELQVSSPVKLRVELVLKASAIVERVLHRRYRAQRVSREWFNYEGPIARFVEREQAQTERQNRVSESLSESHLKNVRGSR